MAGGGIVLVAIADRRDPFDPGALALAGAAVLGGIVVWGSNNATAEEAAANSPRPSRAARR